MDVSCGCFKITFIFTRWQKWHMHIWQHDKFVLNWPGFRSDQAATYQLSMEENILVSLVKLLNQLYQSCGSQQTLTFEDIPMTPPSYNIRLWQWGVRRYAFHMVYQERWVFSHELTVSCPEPRCIAARAGFGESCEMHFLPCYITYFAQTNRFVTTTTRQQLPF